VGYAPLGAFRSPLVRFREPRGPTEHHRTRRTRSEGDAIATPGGRGRMVGGSIGAGEPSGAAAAAEGTCRDRPPETSARATSGVASRPINRSVDAGTPPEGPERAHAA
jgi:hypothetical protein